MIFKGSVCSLFPDAVVTSIVKESLRSAKRGSLNVLAVYRSSNCPEQL